VRNPLEFYFSLSYKQWPCRNLPHPLPAFQFPYKSNPLTPARASGAALWAPPAGSGAEPQPKSNFVHVNLKIWHLVATILILCLRINWPNSVRFKHSEKMSDVRGGEYGYVMRMVGGSSRCRYLWPGVFACRRKAIHHVLLIWSMYQRAVHYVTKYRDKKYSWCISTYHVVNPRGLVFLAGGDAC